WREWEKVLSLSNHIVVTRPGVDIGFSHVTHEVQRRIVDMRQNERTNETAEEETSHLIYITDAVNIDISATDIRRKIREQDLSWQLDVPGEVANYVEKYQIY